MQQILIQMKNNKLFLLLIAFLCLNSCSEEEFDTSTDLIYNDAILKSSGDGIYDKLGYGMDPTKGYLDNYVQEGSKVIDVETLIKDYPDNYEAEKPHFAVTDTKIGYDALDYISNFSSKFKASLGGQLLPTLTRETKVTTSNTISSKHSYATFYQLVVTKKMILKHPNETLKKYLTTQFKNDLRLLSPVGILEKYGTHVYTNISIGGRLEAHYSSLVETQEKKKTVSAGISSKVKEVLNIETNIEADLTLKSNNQDVSFHCVTYGGNGSSGIDIIIDPNASPNLKTNYSSWMNTVDASNSVLVDVGNKSLIPIYELISDISKANQIKEASIRYLENRKISQTNGSIDGGFGLSSSYDKIISLDYNGDGTQDILIYRSGGRKVFLNEGLRDGSFKNVVASSNGLGTYDFNSHNDLVITLDFNGDGKDDLMCYRPGSKIVYLLKSNGDGTFSKTYSSSNGIASYDFSNVNDKALVLDFNRDGKADLMCYRPGSKIAYLLRGNGNGTFTTVYSSKNGIAGFDFSRTNDKAIAFDYNGDGYDDILMYRSGSKIVYIAKSNGNGTFNNVYASGNGIAGYDFNSSYDHVIAVDFNGDQKDDLVCYRSGGGHIYILKSNGNATFSLEYSSRYGIAGYDLKSFKDRIISLDYNNDNLGDLILYRPESGTAYSAKANMFRTGALYTRDYPY